MSTNEVTNKQASTPSKKSSKAHMLAELNLFRERLSLMIKIQANAHQRAKISDDPVQVHLERLNDYDQFMGLLVDSFEGLDAEISAKHAGGAPKNKHRELAYRLLTDHYIGTGKYMQAKALARSVTNSLPENLRDGDANGNEVFTERIAREVINIFKSDLIIEIADN